MKRIFGVSFLSAFSFLCFQILEEPIFLVLGIGLLVYSIIKCRFLNRRIILFLFIFLPILISFRTYFKIQQVKQIEKYIEHHEHMTFCGVISNIENRKSGYRILLDKVSSDGHRLGKAYLYKSKCTYCVGDRILSKGKISLPKIAKNDGGYDERDNLYGIGVHFKSYDPKISIEHRPIFSLNRALYRFRVRISENLHKNLPKEEGDLVSAMCVGDKSDTANDAKELFRLAGIISLLAVSGTHISVVSKRLYNLLRKKRFSYLSCLIISGIISICYGRICGNSIS
ncbi:MAG: ComEC/Rec2 family competence protein, partial [Lachnospiraceae bacterium]|nr:ComEC/Rec2 family competence protein [Lachnospiraceae bacterium]